MVWPWPSIRVSPIKQGKELDQGSDGAAKGGVD